MVDLKKHELPDDELDNVSGGAFAKTAPTCTHCAPIDTSIPDSCSNCSHISGGYCPYK